MKQVLFSFLWIVTGILLCGCLFIFDVLLCFESQLELFASLSWGSVGILSIAILTEGLIFWLSAKPKPISVFMVSLVVCLALVGFGIEISGFPDIYSADTGRFSKLVYNQLWYKTSILVLFVLPLMFWGYHAFKDRKGN